MVGIPPGITLIRRLRGGKNWSLDTYKNFVLLLTFLAYACYHASRKPTSIVKSVLDPQIRRSGSSYPWPVGNVFVKDDGVAINMTRSHGEGWAPFNGEDGTAKLGEIDVAFLSCYSMGMYVAGHLGDTLDLRLFLAAGMIGSGIFVGLFGMGYFWDIHFFGFYLGMQMIAGLFQATGWPSVVAIIGNWFGKAKRGLIMGVWNAHTSVGNIIGSLVAAAVLQYGWGWSFILPGALMFSGGIMVYLLLPPYPELLGLPCPYGRNVPNTQAKTPNDEESLIQGGDDIQPEVSSSNHQDRSVDRGGAVGLAEACFIPGVIPFALCLFFSKLVAYTFLYWLPFYLSQTAIGGEYVSVKSAGNLSTLFDVGGIVGGILAGYISDKLKARAITAATFTFFAIPALLLYRIYGGLSQSSNIALMMLAGLFVNGPYSLITTAVSADLGTQSLRGNARALATVTAIIDGTGSVGAAIGPLLTGFLSKKGWDAVFIMLVVGAAVAGMLLTRLVVAEIAARPWNQNSQTNDSGQQGIRGSAAEPLLHEETRR